MTTTDGAPGELYALITAALWAAGSVLFSRVRVAAAALNLLKNTLAGLFVLATLALLAWMDGAPLVHVDPAAVAWLAVSAFVGLFLGDTFHFRSIQILGPRRALVIETLGPPLGALCGYLVLDEVLTGTAGVGIAVTLLGVVWVVRERPPADESAGHFPGTTRAGVLAAFASALCQAIGAAWSKKGILILAAESSRPALEASAIRLATAIGVGCVAAVASRRLGSWIVQVRAAGAWPTLVLASFCGAYLGIFTSMLAFQHAKVGVAATLTATTPIFVLPMVRAYLRQRVSMRAVVGAAVAVAGVAILLLR